MRTRDMLAVAARQARARFLESLLGLNSRGVTIVMVTHDENVAAHARRLVLLRDGRVESDTAHMQQQT
ncbi:MAG: hypothetical protein AB1700_09265, partial [Bacillota bacterium]